MIIEISKKKVLEGIKMYKFKITKIQAFIVIMYCWKYITSELCDQGSSKKIITTYTV